MKRISFIFLLFLSQNITSLEKDYQIIMNNYLKGEMEYSLDDRTRVDIITDDYAIEVDWASKWAEAIGQSLYYSAKTKRIPGIVLILKNAKEYRYVSRLLLAIFCIKDISIWIIDKDFFIEKIR